MPKLKKEEIVSLPSYNHQKLQRVYTHGGGAYDSVRNIVKASNLPMSKVGHLLVSKPSNTNFTLATRKFEKMEAFARYKIQIWCIDLVYDNKLARVNNGVNFLLVRQISCDRTAYAKGMNHKIPKERFVLF